MLFRSSIQAVDKLASSSEAIVGIDASSSASLPTPNVCKPPLQAPVFSFSAPSRRLTQYNKLGLVPREALPQPYPPQKKVCVRVPAQRKRKHHKPSAEQDESRYIYSNLAKKSATGQGLGPEQHRQPGSSSFRQTHCLDNIYQLPRPPDQTQRGIGHRASSDPSIAIGASTTRKNKYIYIYIYIYDI